VTGNDHTHALHGDAITDALRSPALPFERVHETAVLAEMADALTTAPEPSSLRRHRRVAAFAAVTVASLGVGGIIAAGPVGFRPFVNDDKPPATTIFDNSEPAPAPDELDDDVDDDDGVNDDGVNDDGVDNDNGGGTDRITTDPNFDCVDDATNHGQTVSSAAQAPGSNRAAAQSECGKPVSSGSAGNESGDEVIAPGTLGNGNGNGHGNDGIPGPPASTPGNPNPGPPASTPNNGNGNGNDGIPGPPASTPGNLDPGPPASTPASNPDNGNDGTPGPPASNPGNPNLGPPASTPNNDNGNNGNGNTTTTQPAG
jgi:hypothetical protein